jgi:membrane-bound lytic murein transglycosylase D
VKTLQRAVSLGAVGLLLASCATTRPNRSEVRQFDPLPATEVAVEDLAPITPESVNKLLGDAERSFREANSAQERGDHGTALKHYTAMLELLIEADLDPKVFYQLRTEFQRILDTSFREARLFDPAHPRSYRLDDLSEFLADMEIPNPLPRPVLAEIELIQKGYASRFQSALNRSGKYLPYIREELAQAGLPQDLCWLVMVESQFTPKIDSPAGAGGMWQFMKTTGKRYNLRIDGHVDERYDWQKATHAAIGYLRDLYIFFDGDWALAISAYNMGEGGLSRAITAAKGERDIWRLIGDEGPAQIRSETRKFYPRFLASMIVAKNPERYGFSYDPLPVDNLIHVAVNGSYPLSALEQGAGLPAESLKKLNPHLLRGVTPPGGTYEIAVPSDFGQRVQLALQSTPQVKPEPQVTPDSQRVHVVRRGETLAAISARYGVPTPTLAKVNKLRSPNHLVVGQRLMLTADGRVAPAPAPVATPAPRVVTASTSNVAVKPLASEGQKTYKVRRGDTLFDIARAHRVTVEDLQQWNDMKRSSRIVVGQTLIVGSPAVHAVVASAEVVASTQPAPAPVMASLATNDGAGATPEVKPRYHTVQRGEFPAKIARLYDVNVNDFLKWNKLQADSSIHPGEKLVVYAEPSGVVGTTSDVLQSSPNTRDEQPAAPAPKTHTVKKGETAGTIAEKHKVRTSDLLKWNNLTSKSVLQIGKVLVVSNPGTAAAAAKSGGVAAEGKKTEHVVARGHNPSTIARQHGVSLNDLFAWNGWSKTPVLHPGDKVVVYKK